jgi:hypothetical protein
MPHGGGVQANAEPVPYALALVTMPAWHWAMLGAMLV